MKIKNRLNELQNRFQIPIYEKIEVNNDKSNVIKTDRKKLYKYYKCDYCNDEIIVNKKQEERSGGILELPHTLTKCGKVKIVLCNKCLNKAIKEFL